MFTLTYFTEATDTDRDLTAEEYEELRTLMDEFYTTEFQADPVFEPFFESYETTFNTVAYTPGGIPHINIDFDADFVFSFGSAITPNQVLVKMESLDYQSFITQYLFRNPPLNQLDSVMAVGFTASTTPV